MNREEFKQWASDIKHRLPDLGHYIAQMPKQQRDTWFRDIFERFELRDAMAVNRKLFETGEGVSKFERDKLPSLFIKLLSEQSHSRKKREDEHRQAKSCKGAWEHVTKRDAVMAPSFRELCDLNRRAKEGEITSEEYRQLKAEWDKKWWDEDPEDNQFNAALAAEEF